MVSRNFSGVVVPMHLSSPSASSGLSILLISEEDLSELKIECISSINKIVPCLGFLISSKINLSLSSN